MRRTKWIAILAVLVLVAAACGDSSTDEPAGLSEAEVQAQIDAAVAKVQADAAAVEGGVSAEELQAAIDKATADAKAAAEAAAAENMGPGEPSIIRFAFAPDPAWDFLVDTGTLEIWEVENNIKIVASSTWDEFTYFAGGHGDVVSMGTQEIPVLETETSIKTVTFGKYNFQRSPMMRRAGDTYETLADVPVGSNICVSSPVSNTGFWTVAANELHGLDYRVGGGDYNLIVNDHFVNPTNLLRGDCEVAVAIPEAVVPHLRKGEIELMYDGLMPFQLYSTFSGIADGENHVLSNLFTATEEWYDGHPTEVKAFLALWQEGVDLWNANQAQIIETYPEHFAVQETEDIAYMIEFMAGDSDWFVESVYMEDAWVEAEVLIYDLMVKLHPDNPNGLPADYGAPRFESVAP